MKPQVIDQAYIIFFGVSALIFTVIEIFRRTSFSSKLYFSKEFPLDLISLFLSFLGGGAASGILKTIFLKNSILENDPLRVDGFSVIRIFGCLILMDVVTYAIHRLLHEVQSLNRIHDWHHTIAEMNWLAGFRSSAMQSFFLTFPANFLVPFLIMQCSALEALICFSVQVLFQMWAHSNIETQKDTLLGIFITPRFHACHHFDQVEYYNTNYASIFAFIDKLGGTYKENIYNRETRPAFGSNEKTSRLNRVKKVVGI